MNIEVHGQVLKNVGVCAQCGARVWPASTIEVHMQRHAILAQATGGDGVVKVCARPGHGSFTSGQFGCPKCLSARVSAARRKVARRGTRAHSKWSHGVSMSKTGVEFRESINIGKRVRGKVG